MPSITSFMQEIHAINEAKGWYERPFSPLELSMLIVTEVAELVEEFRKPDVSSEKIAEELADVVIRSLDLANRHSVDLEAAIIDKIEKNRQRSYRHGGKRY